MTGNLDDDLARRFLKILDEKAKSFTYQTFHDTEAKEKDPSLAYVIPGPARDRLLDLHERGAGIYVTVNETSDKAIRRDANIIRVRAVWREADAANLPELPIEPSLIVKTSPGHSHEYFLVADDWPADAQGRADFAAVMERMVETYKSDKNAKDLCRVLRVPGFLHRKHEPHLIRISKPNGGGEKVRRYTRAEILAAFPPIERPKKPDKPQRHNWSNDDRNDLERARDALGYINADDRKTWLDVGMALNDRFGEAGRRLWDEWSASSSKYDAREQEKNWRSFGRRDGITIASLFHYAQQAGWCGNSATRFNGSGQQSAEPRAPPSNGKDGAKPLLWPYEARVFSAIPRRRWLHAGHYIRGQVVMTVAPGGYGKTSLILCNAIEMVTGRGLIGPAPAGAINVAYWNGEDPDEEIERRIAAACLRYQIDPASLRDRLFLGSRLTDSRRVASVDNKGNIVFDAAILAEVERLIGELRIDVVIFDPLVAFHRIPESDNMLMEQVIKDGFGAIAARTDSCIELSQHTRKGTNGRQGDLTADDSRGAGAIINATRSVRVLNRMSAEEAELPKIEPEERRHYLRVSRDKANMAPPGKAAWRRLVDVELPNGDDVQPGDHVQAVESWDYPQPLDNVTAGDMRWMREAVRQHSYRFDARSPDWVGIPLAQRLNLNAAEPADRKKLNSVLRVWFANGVLAVETRKDGIRHERQYVVPGAWNEGSGED
jgi:hypothetical protein